MTEAIARTPIEIRPYEDADADAVSALFGETNRLDPTVRVVGVEEWRSFTRLPFNRDARDFAVAIVDGGIVAQLASTVTTGPDGPESIRHFRIVVHPAWRRHGIGSALFATVEADVHQERTLQSNCPEEWADGRGFLERRGFEPVETDLTMVREGAPSPSHFDVPGITIRPYAGSGDDAAWAAIHNEAYRHERSFFELSPGSMGPYVERAGFGLLLAESTDEGTVVGFCWTIAGTDEAEIESLAVLPAWRGRGIGRMLLTAALRKLAGGIGRCALNVFEENTAAFSLYRSLGFEITSRTYRYWRRPAAKEKR